MVECRLCKADAVGSSPSTSTIYIQQKGHMEQHEKNLLKESLYADDIDLLILAIRRLEDELEHAKNMLPLPDQEAVDTVEVEITDPNQHQKYWTPVPVSELADELERKYETHDRTCIPKRFTTPY